GVEDHHGGDDGLEQGEDDLEEGLTVGAAVNVGCFLQGDGDIALDKAVEHEHRHGHGEAGVHEDQGDAVVEHVEGAAVDAHQGNHDGLEGDDHGGHHQSKGDLGDDVVAADDVVGQHGGQQGDQHGGRHRYDQGVF